jgi:purine catabolism regulator
MSLTVREALDLPLLAGSEVLAGAAGLDRVITGVTVLDAPDGAKFVRGGEFILSNLYVYRDRPEQLLAVVDELRRRQAAGLAIKDRFMPVLSPDFCSKVDDWEFPVIRLPGPLTWVDIIATISKEIVGRQAQELVRSWEIQRRFINLALEGRGLEVLAAALADLVANPVLIVDGCTGSSVSAPSRGADGSGEKIRVVPGRPWMPAREEVMRRIPEHAELRRIFSPSGQPERLVCPIRSGRQLSGWIVVWEEHTLDKWGLIALEHAATVAALEIEKSRALQNLRRSMQEDFLYHLVRGEYQSESTARARAREVGWELADAYVAVVFRVVSTPLSWSDGEEGQVAWRVADLLKACGLPERALVGVDNAGRPLLLYPIAENISLEIADREVAREVAKLIAFLAESQKNLRLIAGVGGPRQKLDAVKDSYREAVTALRLASVGTSDPVARFRELGVCRLLQEGCSPAVREFVNEMLGPLLAYDRQHRSELLPTLQAFLEQGGNCRQAAQALHLHPNTVRYRLSLVEKICRVDLRSPSVRFNLQLALRLWLYDNLVD